MSKKPTPMCTVPVNHVVISAYDYRILIEDLHRFCGENTKLRQDLKARISEIDNLQKALDEAKEELESAKGLERFWYEKCCETKRKLDELKEKSDAGPENS